MIYDELKNISKYRGISANLDTAIAFLEESILSELPMGKTVIDGEKVFINVMEADAKEREEIAFEIHKRYMDIQIDIEGTEAIEIGEYLPGVKEQYDERTDFGTVDCSNAFYCIMGEGRFIICMTCLLYTSQGTESQRGCRGKQEGCSAVSEAAER